jgi:hypothetical protein
MPRLRCRRSTPRQGASSPSSTTCRRRTGYRPDAQSSGHRDQCRRRDVPGTTAPPSAVVGEQRLDPVVTWATLTFTLFDMGSIPVRVRALLHPCKAAMPCN